MSYHHAVWTGWSDSGGELVTAWQPATRIALIATVARQLPVDMPMSPSRSGRLARKTRAPNAVIPSAQNVDGCNSSKSLDVDGPPSYFGDGASVCRDHRQEVILVWDPAEAASRNGGDTVLQRIAVNTE